MARSAAAVRVFSDDGHCVHDARLMRRALEYVKPFDAVDRPARAGSAAGRRRRVRARGRAVRPARAARLAGGRRGGDHRPRRDARPSTPARGCTSATSRPPAAVEVMRWAKARGIDVTAEVTPHHLLLTCDLLAGYDPVYKVNPPLRPAEDVAGAARRRWPTARSTRSPPTTRRTPPHDKDHAFGDAAFGMLGLQTALGVVAETMVATGLLDWAGVADRMSVRPALIGRLAGHGRPIAVGEPANLTLVDPARVVGWSTRPRWRRCRATRRSPAARCRRAWWRRSCAAGRPSRDGALRRAGGDRDDATRSWCWRTAGRFTGEAYGAVGETFGEAVFATGMTGYQETLTDPSYHRQVVVQTAPHIGNTGVNDEDAESRRIWVAGYVVRDPARRPSNWRSRALAGRRAGRAGRSSASAASTPGR